MVDPIKLKLVMGGATNVGKTALVNRYCNDAFSDATTTISAAHHTISLTLEETGDPCTVILWDTGGQERFAKLTQTYVRSAGCIVLAFDLTKRESYTLLPERIQWMHDIEPTAAVVIVGTKADIVEDQPGMREVAFEVASDFAAQHKAVYFETSAKRNTGVHEAFAAAVAAAYRVVQAGHALGGQGEGSPELELVKEVRLPAPGNSPDGCCR